MSCAFDIAEGTGRVEDLGVVHHDADGPVGHPARPVLHFPLRMDPARRSVGRVHDTVALRVAACLLHRLEVVHRPPVVRMDPLERVFHARRARCRIEPPEAEDVPVPSAFAGRDLAFPEAEPAEFLGRVEQLALAARLAGQEARRADVGEVPEDAGAEQAGACIDPERGAVGGAQLDGDRVERACVERGGQAPARGVAGSAFRRERVDGRAAIGGDAGRGDEALVGPLEPAVAAAHGHQLQALAEQRRQHVGRWGVVEWRNGSVAHGCPAGARAAPEAAKSSRRAGLSGAPSQASATCSTSLPKFSPRNSRQSVSGKVSRPTTTSSRLVIRPSFR